MIIFETTINNFLIIIDKFKYLREIEFLNTSIDQIIVNNDIYSKHNSVFLFDNIKLPIKIKVDLPSKCIIKGFNKFEELIYDFDNREYYDLDLIPIKSYDVIIDKEYSIGRTLDLLRGFEFIGNYPKTFILSFNGHEITIKMKSNKFMFPNSYIILHNLVYTDVRIKVKSIYNFKIYGYRYLSPRLQYIFFKTPILITNMMINNKLITCNYKHNIMIPEENKYFVNYKLLLLLNIETFFEKYELFDVNLFNIIFEYGYMPNLLDTTKLNKEDFEILKNDCEFIKKHNL